MKHILIHDWSDDRCRTLLGNIAAVMQPSGHVLILETVMPLGPEPHPEPRERRRGGEGVSFYKAMAQGTCSLSSSNSFWRKTNRS